MDEPLRRFAKRHRVPAVAAAVVPAEGPVEVHVFGVRRRGSRDPALVSARWHIGSCTKTFTAALWGRLVELGYAEWDMPLEQALADLRGDMHPDWMAQTVDSVLWCRAGFKANLSPDQMQQAWDDSRPLADQRTDAARQALSDPPDRPGDVRYSNLGLIVVGAVIDRLAGATFEQALDTHVLAPLGIESAGFGPPSEIWGHPARFRFGDFGLLAGPPADPADPFSDNPAVFSAAGTMHITMSDWAKFVRVFMVGGSNLLRDSTVDRLLQTPHGGEYGMAMGWLRTRTLPGAGYVMQGSNTMWSTAALIDSDRRRAVLVACNDGRNRVLSGTARLAARLLSTSAANA
ncbi:MAG: beta-lactamase family protein [Acidimicrobiia bacterium]|nr:beta-lactamase family protein [Acidimicrobiia bacterium]